jgi:hypothetical protein
MKTKLYIFLLCILALSLVTCVSTPQAGKTPAESGSESIATPSAPKVAVEPVNPFYTGSGGKGISIAILAPKAAGITENQAHIPALVQGEFVSNFSGYSALSVMDRENLDNVYGELQSGYYDDNDEAGLDFGRLSSTDYLLNGSITKTATGYALQIKITKTADKMTAASFSGTCTFTELDNLTGVRLVSLDLLQKMGIELTDRAKTELAGAAAVNHVNAQSALAQGITAQKGGTVVEALSYYYQAASFDSSLQEAASRAGVISAAISGGNIGANVRNDIQRRNEWLKILDEADNFFKEHLPWEIIYYPTLTQGRVDYAKETVDISFRTEVRPTEGFKTINTILAGLKKTGKIEEWGMIYWPLSSSVFVDRANSPANGRGDHPVSSGDDMYSWPILKKISTSFQLVNANNKVIGTSNDDIWCSLRFRNFTSGLFYDNESTARLRRQLDVAGQVYGWDMSVEASPVIENIVFLSVNANDITDSMTVKIVSVNGISAEEAGQTGHIRISAAKIRS